MVWRPWPPAGGKEATLNLRQHADRRSAFTPGRVAIETDDGTVLKSLDQPRASFAGHTAETPWSTVQLAYFAGGDVDLPDAAVFVHAARIADDRAGPVGGSRAALAAAAA